MALDFCIRNNHDSIIISIPVEYSLFNEMIEKSKIKPATSIITEKLTDYFEDAEFYINELPRFRNELENLHEEFLKIEYKEVIYLLINLCDIAVKLNKTISVFAD